MVDTCHVTGIVISPDGDPVPRATVRFQRLPHEVFVEDDKTGIPREVRAEADEEGNIAVDLIPGEYKVLIIARGYNQYPAFNVGVPDQPTAVLADIQDVPPPPSLDDATRAVRDAREARDESREARDEAAASAQTAAENAENAATSATNAHNKYEDTVLEADRAVSAREEGEQARDEAQGAAQEAVDTVADTAKKSSNLADLTNLKEALINLGSFSSVVEVQAHDILPTVESIHAAGSALQRSDGASPLSVRSKDGAWWAMPSASAPLNRYLTEYVDDDLSTSPSTRYVLGVAHGQIIGQSSGGSIRASDDGFEWQTLFPSENLPFSLDDLQSSIHALDDGEVLVNISTELWKSSGWPSPGTTWTKVLESASYLGNRSRFHMGWGIRVSGQYVFVIEYGSPKPIAHQAYLSTNYGNSFSSVWDQRNHYDITESSNAHMHGCCIDPWHGGTPRLWVHSSDSGFIGLWYSDNLGGNWSPLPDSNYRTSVDRAAGIEPTNDVILDATPYGIVIGTDNKPDGCAMIPRDARYSADPYVKTILAFNDPETQISHVAQSSVVVDEWVFHVHNPSGDMVSGGISRVPPRITATNSKTQQAWIVWEGPLDFTSLRKIDLFNGYLWVRNIGTSRMLRIPLFQSDASKTTAPWTEDPGNVLGGRKENTFLSLSIHPLAEAGGLHSMALGAYSRTRSTRQLVMAPGAHVVGVDTVAIGPGVPSDTYPSLTVESARAVVIGHRSSISGGDSSVVIGDRCEAASGLSVAIGFQASAGGSTSSIAVGRQATAGTEAIAIGRGADADTTRSIAIGKDAAAGGISAVAIGQGASATEGNALALGREAVAEHGNSVAIGYNASTEYPNEAALGNRYLTMGVFSTNRATPGAGRGALWFHDTGSGIQVRASTPGGSIYAIDMTQVV